MILVGKHSLRISSHEVTPAQYRVVDDGKPSVDRRYLGCDPNRAQVIYSFIEAFNGTNDRPAQEKPTSDFVNLCSNIPRGVVDLQERLSVPRAIVGTRATHFVPNRQSLEPACSIFVVCCTEGLNVCTEDIFLGSVQPHLQRHALDTYLIAAAPKATDPYEPLLSYLAHINNNPAH